MHPGEFYALPQSPQLFKQLLMMAGFDRYYQIARCFRDEDLRADRQPEFTQLDMEFAFVEERDVQDAVEAMIRDVFKDVAGVELADPFPRMTYAEAMRRYGSDKPDLRFALELVDIAEHVKHVEFKVFSEPANDPGGRVARCACRTAPSCRASISTISARTSPRYGAKGLAWIRVDDLREGSRRPRPRRSRSSSTTRRSKASSTAVGAQSGDVIFFGAGPYKTVSDFMGALRLKVARDRGLVANTWTPLWVTDFPMFEYDHEAKRYVALHHPFTAPKVDDIADLKANADNRGLARLRHGAQRQRDRRRLDPHPSAGHAERGIRPARHRRRRSPGEIRLPARSAASYGAPPHGGIAFGIDRIAALMAGTESIRDVIAFPKTATAQDLMTAAPSIVAEAQLQELHVRVVKPQGSRFSNHDERTRHPPARLVDARIHSVALSRRIEREGFTVHLFDYASVMHDPEQSIAQLLVARVRAREKVHFVGHSLGGDGAHQSLCGVTRRPLRRGRLDCGSRCVVRAASAAGAVRDRLTRGVAARAAILRGRCGGSQLLRRRWPSSLCSAPVSVRWDRLRPHPPAKREPRRPPTRRRSNTRWLRSATCGADGSCARAAARRTRLREGSSRPSRKACNGRRGR